MTRNNIIKRMCFVAAFAAIASVLYCTLKFPLPIFPSFLDINFSMIPVIICCFMLSPWDGLVVILIRFLMKIWIVGTGTAYVGELADIIMGSAVVLAAGCIYKYTNFKHKTLFAFISVVVVWVVSGILTNVFINIPFYLDFYFKGNWAPLIGMCSDGFRLITFGAVDGVTQDNFMLFYITLGVIPFNLLLSLIVVVFTAPVHKRLRVLYDMIGEKKE